MTTRTDWWNDLTPVELENQGNIDLMRQWGILPQDDPGEAVFGNTIIGAPNVRSYINNPGGIIDDTVGNIINDYTEGFRTFNKWDVDGKGIQMRALRKAQDKAINELGRNSPGFDDAVRAAQKSGGLNWGVADEVATKLGKNSDDAADVIAGIARNSGKYAPGTARKALGVTTQAAGKLSRAYGLIEPARIVHSGMTNGLSPFESMVRGAGFVVGDAAGRVIGGALGGSAAGAVSGGTMAPVGMIGGQIAGSVAGTSLVDWGLDRVFGDDTVRKAQFQQEKIQKEQVDQAMRQQYLQGTNQTNNQTQGQPDYKANRFLEMTMGSGGGYGSYGGYTPGKGVDYSHPKLNSQEDWASDKYYI